MIKNLIDNLQNVFDRRKVCSEVHIIAKKNNLWKKKIGI